MVIQHKLAQAAAHHDGEFIVDDTTLTFNCIKPLPGTLSKWFETSLGTAGMAELVSHYSDHSAIGAVTIGYRNAQGNIKYFTGEYHGTIVPPQGDNGFGFDPIFLTDGQKKTNAQLPLAKKLALSARGKAARQLLAHLQNTQPA